MYKKRRVLFASALLATVTSSFAAETNAPAANTSIQGCPSGEILKNFGQFAKTGKMPPAFGKWLNTPEAQKIEPYKVFDNVYNVGICWVNAWVIKTSDGPILIDTLYGPYFDQMIENMAEIGVKPADLKLVLMTHGHFDHVGGASRLKKMTSAPFVMSDAGWKEAQEHSLKNRFMKEMKGLPAEEDITAKDGDIFTLGDTQFQLFETPGHTWGTSSYVYNVKDGDTEVRAITVGGLGLNGVNDPKQIEGYINSVKRINGMVTSKDNPVVAHIPTHSFGARLTEKLPAIKNRKAGEPHPLVDKEGVIKQLEFLRNNAEKRLSSKQS